MPNDLEDPTQSRAADAPLDSLDFERAEKTSNAAPACAQCATPITDRYFTLGSHTVCEACHFAFQNMKAPGNPATRFVGAAGLGAIAAAVGCGIWMAVTELTGWEIGLVAIVVGYIVGLAVHVGSRRVGGLAYQLLAVVLTYSAIVMTYVPMIAAQLNASEEFHSELAASGAEAWAEDQGGYPATDAVESEEVTPPVLSPEQSATIAWIYAIPYAYMLPFLMGFENAIGILIIGFALWQAFRMNARAKIDLQGPFRLQAHDTAVG